jgi:hypothetical protein
MPVNTAALKTFAPAMRRQLIEAVGRKLDRLLHQISADTLTTTAGPINELRQQEATNRQELLERVAYSWFNRLAAVRYLDARGWHPFGAKVLMPQTETETQPEVLKLLRSGSLPAELQPHTNETRLQGLLDGRIPTAMAGADPQGEVYRELILAVCRSYHQLLPNLFEGLDDASELLLPDDLLSDGSIAGGFRHQISDSDCDDVEILGWLYQFYIAEKKDEVMARKKAVPTEDIPAVTQLFTPHWIVRYLVENSLGRLWLLNRPESKLREQMPYYIEGETETDFLRITKPEDIKLLDPACGSGHMLTYAFDLLSHIYTEEGYAAAEIPGLILQHNLYGLDICPRAAQLAGLALVLKAREQSRRFFQPGQLVQPQIIELQDVRFAEGELNDYIETLDFGELFDPNLFKLLHQFEEAKNFGSLIQPCLDEPAIADARRAIEAKELGNQLFLRETHRKVLRVLEQAEALTQRHHVVVANPPYMGNGRMNASMKAFAKKHYRESEADLFSIFMQRSTLLAEMSGYSAMVTMQTWMFLSSFEDLRASLLKSRSLVTLIQIGYNSFPEMNSKVAQACAFVFKNIFQDAEGFYVNLNDVPQAADKEQVFLEKLRRGEIFRASSKAFKSIPGSPIAYWLAMEKVSLFPRHRQISEARDPQVGLQTSDNARFVRFWWEISQDNLCLGATSSKEAEDSGKTWFPFNKGGDGRKWSANAIAVVNWKNNGSDIKQSIVQKYPYLKGNPDYVVKDRGYYFKPGVVGNKISSTGFSVAYTEAGFLHSNADMLIPTETIEQANIYCAFLNSSLAKDLLEAIAPTLNFEKGQIGSLPIPEGLLGNTLHASKCIELSKLAWDENEISMEFMSLSTSKNFATAEELVDHWIGVHEERLDSLKTLERLNDEAVLESFSLFNQGDGAACDLIRSNINIGDYSLNQPSSLMAKFLSYATGCMMGRYSLDHPGLILANAGDTLENYDAKVGKSSDAVAFQPDRDGIIPVLDGEWFEDDIVARSREFLRVTFPASSLNTDLAFIETSLGKDLRKYFCSDFYKDHLQTYKKRPIYWLVQSPAGPGKGGFACLIYLHRYTKDTLNLVLNNYFRPYLQKLEARQAQLGLDQLNDDLPARERTAARKEAEKISKVLKECQAWEQDALLPLAQQRIELDLDDGVKVNYLKLQDVLAPIPGLAAKEE